MKRISLLLRQIILIYFILNIPLYAVPQPVYIADLTYRNVKTWYSVKGDNSTDDYANLIIANTKAHNHTLYFPSGTYKINSDLSFDSTITLAFENGAKLKPSNGVVITINGGILASPAQQIVDVSAGGAISWGSKAVYMYSGAWIGGPLNIGIGTTTIPYTFNINGSLGVLNIIITISNPPITSTSTGTTGQIAWDANFLYVCIATNIWKRTAISTW